MSSLTSLVLLSRDLTNRDRITRVVKVGGSLFDLPSLPMVFAQWLKRQPPAFSVLVAGGGAMVDAIRRLDQTHPQLDPERIHWACIGVMTASARCLAALLPEVPLLDNFGALCQQIQGPTPKTVIFSIEPFLRSQNQQTGGAKLPCAWSVTSDSIAASLAEALHADELVLLKSADLPEATNSQAAAAAGCVDAFFPTAAQNLSIIRWVNLRNAHHLDACLRNG